jgi:hypothetical protein
MMFSVFSDASVSTAGTAPRPRYLSRRRKARGQTQMMLSVFSDASVSTAGTAPRPQILRPYFLWVYSPCLCASVVKSCL